MKSKCGTRQVKALVECYPWYCLKRVSSVSFRLNSKEKPKSERLIAQYFAARHKFWKQFDINF